MPYNRSRACVIRRKRFLDDMKIAGRTITWPTNNPTKLAYQIREALWATQFHPEFERYAELRFHFRIKSRRGFVEANYIGPLEEEISGSAIPDRMEVPNVTEPAGLVGAAIKFQSRTDEIYFPKAILDDNQKRIVWQWAKTEGWYLIDQEDEGVTLTRRPINAIYIWEPPEEEDRS